MTIPGSPKPIRSSLTAGKPPRKPLAAISRCAVHSRSPRAQQSMLDFAACPLNTGFGVSVRGRPNG